MNNITNFKNFLNENNDYKNYMVYLHPNNNEIFIDRFIKIINGEIFFKIIKKFDIKNNNWENLPFSNRSEDKFLNNTEEDYYKKRIIYTSNSMEDCLEFVDSYKESIKYNL